MLFLTALSWLGWASLDHYLPWQLVTFGGIVVVFAGSGLLTALLARLPGARGTADPAPSLAAPSRAPRALGRPGHRGGVRSAWRLS